MKIAMLFPGQGSQYVGMGRSLCERYAEAAKIFDKADDVLGFDIRSLCFEGPEDELRMTSNTQPAILTVSIAAFEVLKSMGVTPSFVVGHSLGEYSALVASGVMGFETALRVVRERGLLMQNEAPIGGGMTAVIGLDRNMVDELCRQASSSGVIESANYNCPGQIVVSGNLRAIEEFEGLARSAGAKRIVRLQVGGAFHSSLMNAVGTKLKDVLADIEFKDPQIPVVMNVDARYAESGDYIKERLLRQVSSSVLWEDSIRRMIEDGADLFIEVGPGRVLCGLLRMTDRSVESANAEDVASVLSAVKKAGLGIDEKNV